MPSFNKEELEFIWKQSMKSDFTNDFFLGASERHSIVKQDFNTKLILAKGDDDTGYDHILKRHFGSEMKPFFEEGKRNPTIFLGNIVPYNLLEYACQLYHEEFYIPGDLETPFLKYEEEVKYDQNIKPLKSRLIVYKDFPIIHTYYICDQSAKNKNKLKGLVRGKYSVSENLESGKVTYSCNFFKSDLDIAFQLIIEINPYVKKGNAKIRLNSTKEEFHLDIPDQNLLDQYAKYSAAIFNKIIMDDSIASDIEIFAAKTFWSYNIN